MNNNELYLHYRQAIQLIRVGRYEESLHLLEEIDAERPNTKNVLYAMAVCSEMLGKTDEALELCDRLINEHEHPKARIIKMRIEKAAEEPDLPPVDMISKLGLDEPLGMPIPAPPLPPPPAQEEEEDIPLAAPAEAEETSDGEAELAQDEKPSEEEQESGGEEKPAGKPAKKGWLGLFGKKS